MKSAEIVSLLQSKGYTFACATCDRLDGQPCWGNRSGRRCAGPMAGGSYPHYSGPLSSDMTRFCFLTGEVSVGAVDVGGVMLGVSEKGIEVLRTYSLRGVGSTPEIRGEEVRAKR